MSDRGPLSQWLTSLKFLNKEYDIKHIVWLDDDLLKDHSRAIQLFDSIVKRNLDLTWDATNGVIAASCTDEVVDAMSRSGYHIEYWNGVR